MLLLISVEWNSIVYMCHTFLIHSSPLDRHLGCVCVQFRQIIFHDNSSHWGEVCLKVALHYFSLMAKNIGHLLLLIGRLHCFFWEESFHFLSLFVVWQFCFSVCLVFTVPYVFWVLPAWSVAGEDFLPFSGLSPSFVVQKLFRKFVFSKDFSNVFEIIFNLYTKFSGP